MGLGSRVADKIRSIASEKREQYREKRDIDKAAKKVEREEYINQYRVKKMEQAKVNAKERVQRKTAPIESRVIKNSGKAYTAANSGLNFLNGNTFGYATDSRQTSANINNLLGFGPKRKVKTSIKPKSKVTTIRSGGKTITIRDAPDAEQEKKKERTVADNINDLLGF